MKNLIAILLIACGGCVSTQQVMAQTCGAYTNPCAQPTFNPNAHQVSTAGNGGNLTWNLNQGLDGTYSRVIVSGVAFNPITQDFSGVIQADLTGYYTNDADALAAGGGTVVTAMSWILNGTNGPGCCLSTDRTIVSQASIVPATPLVDASGNAVTGPGYGADSPLETIAQWAPVPGATALMADNTPATFSASGTEQVLKTGVLLPGQYLVAFTATGCTGRGCNIPTYRYFFSHVTFTSHKVSPPSSGPVCPPNCDDRSSR